MLSAKNGREHPLRVLELAKVWIPQFLGDDNVNSLSSSEAPSF